MDRHRCIRIPDLHMHTMVFHNEFDLLNEIISKKIRPRNCRFVPPGLAHVAITQTTINLRITRRLNAHHRVVSPDPLALWSSLHRFGKGLTQELARRFIKRLQLSHSRASVVKSLEFTQIWCHKLRRHVPLLARYTFTGGAGVVQRLHEACPCSRRAEWISKPSAQKTLALP